MTEAVEQEEAVPDRVEDETDLFFARYIDMAREHMPADLTGSIVILVREGRPAGIYTRTMWTGGTPGADRLIEHMVDALETTLDEAATEAVRLNIGKETVQ